MHRCLELSNKGAGNVAPNPMVGAVLVYEEKIIGEGWHQQYGKPHAEVNCVEDAIQSGNETLVPHSTLYVSLEPCAHFGKTPPCVDLIIKHRIPNVVIGSQDPFSYVDGKGIEKLKNAGINVEVGILENESRELNRRFFCFYTQHRPYIVLKWATTSDGFIAKSSQQPGSNRLLISNEYSNRLVHQWRSEEVAILVGTKTALLDDPELTNRLWPGNSPTRLVVDMGLKLPLSLKLFNEKAKTIVFNTVKHEEQGNILYYQVTSDVSVVHQIVKALYQLKIQSVLVEGGARLLQSFIDEGMWDEARVICNMQLAIGKGLEAPRLGSAIEMRKEQLGSDEIAYYRRKG